MAFKKGEAPRVELKDVERAIKKKEFTVLQDGRTTVCLITMDNGFTVRGESSCVFGENFVAELGEKYSYQRALDQVWAYLGFRLAERYHQQRLRKARGVHYRDSISGGYVTKAYALANPDTTEREQ